VSLRSAPPTYLLVEEVTMFLFLSLALAQSVPSEAPSDDKTSYLGAVLVHAQYDTALYTPVPTLVAGLGLRGRAHELVTVGVDGRFWDGGNEIAASVDFGAAGNGLDGWFVGAGLSSRRGLVLPMYWDLALYGVESPYRAHILTPLARVGMRSVWNPGFVGEIALSAGPVVETGYIPENPAWVASLSVGGGLALGRGPLKRPDAVKQKRALTGIAVLTGGLLAAGAAVGTVVVTKAIYEMSTTPVSWGFGAQ
jgi:hypothetical protein